MTHDTTHLTSGSSGGLERRTLVAGAAWTIPVIATAVGAPLAAASTGATLAFINGPYSVAACGTLKDVVLRATTDGTAPVQAGTPVTVTLPTGLTWSDTSTGTKILPTDTNGEVVLSGVTADGAPGSKTITAAGPSTSSASAPVQVTGGSAFRYFRTGTGATGTNAIPVPSGAQPVGVAGWILDGTLYDNSGAVVAADVASANGEFENNGSGTADYLAFVTTGGSAFRWFKTGTGASGTGAVPVPHGAQPVGVSGWLLDGTLYDNSGAVVATGVTSAQGDFENAGNGTADYLAYSTASGGTFRYYRTGTGATGTGAIPVPPGAQPVGVSGWLLDGTLYNNLGSVVATGVTSANGDFENNTGGTADYLSYATESGAAFRYYRTGTGATGTGAIPVPSGAQPVGVSGWLLDSTLYDNTGAVVASGVTATAGDFENGVGGTADYLTYVTGGTCS